MIQKALDQSEYFLLLAPHQDNFADGRTARRSRANWETSIRAAAKLIWWWITLLGHF